MAEDRDFGEELVDYEAEEIMPAADATEDTSAKEDLDTYAGNHGYGFRDFILRPELSRAIVNCGFEHPSQVQHECIPKAILATDVICQAKSGMGKTAVFVLAILHQLDESVEGAQAIVICHTRELAFQICKEFQRFSKFMPWVRTEVFYGGVPVKQHERLLKESQPTIAVGTPGRMKDLVQRKMLHLSKIKHFVLDECDNVLEGTSMRQDVQEVFKLLPRSKQVMMFSATISEKLQVTCKKFMHNPLEVLIDDQKKLTLHGLRQHFVKLSENEKNRKLTDLLDTLEFNQVVIFVRSVARCKELNRLLAELNFPSIAIYGGMDQSERIARFQEFKDFKQRILVATNVMARGIDIERVNIVVNYDMAECADTYLHRVGRAGRFGTKGLAISFLVPDTEDEEVMQAVQKRFEVLVELLPDDLDPTTYMIV